MPRKTLASLGALVRAKRGTRKLREVAREIGIGPATLMRIENGRIPDVTTFAKICRWLEVDPGAFLGFDRGKAVGKSSDVESSPPLVFPVHLRAEQTAKSETVQALATMILLALKRQPKVEEVPGDAVV